VDGRREGGREGGEGGREGEERERQRGLATENERKNVRVRECESESVSSVPPSLSGYTLNIFFAVGHSGTLRKTFRSERLGHWFSLANAERTQSAQAQNLKPKP
jgi:hypothetical protein